MSVRLLVPSPRRSRLLVLPAVLFATMSALSVACAGAPPPPVAALESQPTLSVEAAEEPEDRTPLEIAAAPPLLLARARIKSPGQLLSSVGDAASSPVNLRRFLQELEPGAQRVVERIVDLDGPVEAVVALDPAAENQTFQAWSVSAKGVRVVLRGLDQDHVDVSEGPGGLHYFALDGQPCVVGRSLGSSPARIACADRAESLRALEAYILRGLPTEALSGAAVSVEVLAAPLQKQYGRQLRGLRLLAGFGARQLHQGHAALDAAISDAALGLVEELIAVGEEVEKFELNLWDRQGALELEARLSFAGQASWLVSSALALAERQAPAPEMLRLLPGSASAASYARQLPKAHTRTLAASLSALVAGFCDAKGVSAAARDKLTAAIREAVSADRTMVSATGPLRLRGAGNALRLAPAWALHGVDQPKSAVVLIVDGFAAGLADKQLAKWVEAPEDRPHLARKPLSLPGVPGAVVYEWKLPETLARALDQAEGRFGSASGEPRLGQMLDRFRVGHLAVFEHGGATWMAVSEKPAQLTEAYQALTDTTPRVGSEPALAVFLAAPAALAGYFTLASAFSTSASFLPRNVAEDWQALLRSAPYKGAFPATIYFSVERGPRTTLSLRASLPDELLTDAVATGLSVAAEVAAEAQAGK